MLSLICEMEELIIIEMKLILIKIMQKKLANFEKKSF